jgi:F0F1-type ATP synthase delta subunit
MNGMSFVLPASVVSKVDVAHLVSEAEQIDNEQTTKAVREKVGATTAPSETVLSEQLSDFLTQNQLTIGTSQERSELIKQLHLLKENVPVIHMTFAASADRDSLRRLVEWLRSSVHPQAVISVGLQPALVAGVSIRTTNRVHDLSMRSVLRKNHGLLVKELGALRGNG